MVSTGLRAYADSRGLDFIELLQEIDRGRLRDAAERQGDGNYLIDEEAADKALGIGEFDPKDDVPTDEDAAAQAVLDDDDEDLRRMSFNDAKAEKMRWEARLARLKYKQQMGQLVLKVDEEKAGAEAGQMVKDRLLTIPDRFCDELAAQTDPRECWSILRAALVDALEELSS